MKDVCSPINRMKKATPLPHPDKNKRNPPHAPVYGPPCDGKPQRGTPDARDLGHHFGHARGWPKSERPGPIPAAGSGGMSSLSRERGWRVLPNAPSAARRFRDNRVPRPRVLSARGRGACQFP